jgi:hypothetical protein
MQVYFAASAVAFEKSFSAKDAIAFLKSRAQCNTIGAGNIMQSLSDQGVLARSDGVMDNVANAECPLVLTELGSALIKDVVDVNASRGDDSLLHPSRSLDSARRLVVEPPPPVLWSARDGLTFDVVDGKEFAHQLTLLFHNSYRAIRPYHLLKQNWTKKTLDHDAVNPVAQLFSHIQRLSGWVALEVLQCSTPAVSAAKISKFIAIAVSRERI